MTITAKHDFVIVDGVKLAFSRVGDGPPAVFIHGIPTNRHLWRNVLPKIAAAGFEAIAFDLLGYGCSDKPTDVDLGIYNQARLIAVALRKLNLRRVLLVGHDIGGGVAQLLALDVPELLSHLVLVDSIAYDSFPEPGIARLRDVVWDSILGAPDFDFRKGLSKGFSKGMVRPERNTGEMVEIYERPFHGVDGRKAYLRAARALRTEELSLRVGAIERISLPTLVIWGTHDHFQPISNGRRLASAMPNARFEQIEDAGHFSPEDSPDRLTQLILKFAGTAAGELIP